MVDAMTEGARCHACVTLTLPSLESRNTPLRAADTISAAAFEESLAQRVLLVTFSEFHH